MPNTNFLATEVNPGGLTALINNLGRDCHPTQFLREFAKNSIEACQRTKAPKAKVVVDYNQKIFKQLGLHKICFIDNGDGMTDTQMINLLNNLSASGATQNEFQNYGVGAKISALTRNHSGILYESWRDGVGHAMTIKYNHQEGIYGIEGVSMPDGSIQYAVRIPDGDKPSEIDTHGTRVTLFGMEDIQDTMVPPANVPGSRESWIALYLNTRFFLLPDGIEMAGRVGYYKDNTFNYLSKISGQKAILDNKAQLKGEFQLTDGKLYWWVMPKGADGHGREMVKGHTALINQNEIFDISDSRSNKIAYFGVLLGRDRVIIYIEPTNVVQNTARTGLVRPDGSGISWDKWQDEFRTNMPELLKKFLDELQNENSNESNSENIKERLKHLKELYKLSRFKASPKGNLFANPDSESDFDTGHIRVGDVNPTPSHRPGGGVKPGSLSTALLTALAEEDVGVRVVTTEPDPFPRVKWVKASENNEQLNDRAAEYIQTSNIILANSDFQGFHDTVKFLLKSYSDTPEVNKLIEEEVKQAFEQALTECVAGSLSLKNRPYWNPKDFENALSKEALTTAVMQRYWMISHVRRVLGSKLPKALGEVA